MDEIPLVSSIVPPSDQDAGLRASARLLGTLVEEERKREEIATEREQPPADAPNGSKVVTQHPRDTNPYSAAVSAPYCEKGIWSS